jgi:Pectate lyase superfamily protein
MIVALLLLVLITGFFVCAEVFYERDWPRSTIKGFAIALLLLLMGIDAFGQAARYDQVVSTINQSAPQPGGQYPALYIPNSGIAICTAPANAIPCTNYAVTYTSGTGATACPSSTQLTRPGSNTCIAGADSQGGFGVWMAAGNYQYTVTTTYGSFGPYDFSVSGMGGGGGGASPSPPLDSVQAYGSLGGLVSTPGVTISPTLNRPVDEGPRVDVTFFGADPADANDSTSAIVAALAHIAGNTLSVNTPQLYFPSGTYKISSALRVPCNVFIVGDGTQATTLQQTSTTANALTIIGESGPITEGFTCSGGIRDITIAGTGHLGTGTLVELDNTAGYTTNSLRLYNGGGRALTLNGSTERSSFFNTEIDVVRWPMQLNINTNEDHFFKTNVEGGGQDASGYCWSANCVSGVYPASGAISPDTVSSIFVDGVNIGFYGGSIKPTQFQGGFQVAHAEATRIANFYFEGFPVSHQPRLNAAITVGGVMPQTTLTAALNTSSFPVAAAVASNMWFPNYTNDPQDVSAGAGIVAIFCPDAVPGSTTPCAAVSGVQQGQYEMVNATMAGDGQIHVLSHFGGTVSAVAWPSGSHIEWVPASNSTSPFGSSFGNQALSIEISHFHSITQGSSPYTNNCSDSVPALNCGEIMAGFPFDNLYMSAPGSPQGTHQVAVAIALANNSFFEGGTEVNGEGYVKINTSASVFTDSVFPLNPEWSEVLNGTLTMLTPHYMAVQYTTGAFSNLVFSGPNVNLNAGNGLYNAQISTSDSRLETNAVANGNQFANRTCWYDTPSSSTAHASTRICFWGAPSNASEFESDTWNGSAWVPSFSSTAGAATFSGSGSFVGTLQSGAAAMGNLQNLVIGSSAMSASPWSTVLGSFTSITDGTTDLLSPDGTNDATKFVSGSVNAERVNIGTPLLSSNTYSGCFQIAGASGGESVLMNIGQSVDTGVVTAPLTPLTWSAPICFSGVSPNPSFLAQTFQMSFPNISTVYVYGPVVVVGSTNPSYIGTGASAITSPTSAFYGVLGEFQKVVQGVNPVASFAPASPATGQAACVKSLGPPPIIGQCSTVVSSSGSCTCN